MPALWQAGHRAFTVSLTGVGERAHLLSPQVDLHTHIEDVCATVDAEELQDVILVGHSYAGMVITGVADRLGSRIAQLVYLDAVVPAPGEAWSSRHSPETQAQRRAQIATHGVLPAAAPTAFGLNEADAAWVGRRMTAHPGGVYDQALNYDAQRWSGLRRCFIDCSDPALPTIQATRDKVRQQSGWRWIDIPTGHDAMVSAPEALIKALLSLTEQGSAPCAPDMA